MIRTITGFFCALCLTAILVVAAMAGAFFNALFLMLMTGCGIAIMLRIVGGIRRDLSFRLIKEPKDRATRPYWVQLVIRVSFYLAAAWAVLIAMIPAQFEAAEYSVVVATIWASAIILVVLSVIPLRKVYWSLNVFFALTTMVLVWQISVARSTSADGVVIGKLTNEPWLVMHATGAFLTNHHHFAGSQKYAVDMIPEGDAKLVSKLLADFEAFGEPVLAPCEGEVVEIESHHEDHPIGGSDLSNPAGNFVVIRMEDDVYVLIGHLKRDSINVGVGDLIKTGQVIAACGNSGNTSQPHLHIQIMDGPDMFDPATNPIQLLFDVDGGRVPRTSERY